MSLKPGAFAWLVAHDVRLSWRGFRDLFGGAGRWTVTAVLLGCAATTHLLAWPLLRWLGLAMHAKTGSGLPLAAIVGGIFTWMIAQSVFSTTRTLYDRADLDLLLGSPLSSRRIISAKCLAIMASTLSSVALIAVPIANVGAILDGTAWLLIYPVLIGLALIATSLGLAIAMGLFMMVGPRRARLYANLIGAGLGGAFVLAAQVYAVLPLPIRSAMAIWFWATASTLRLAVPHPSWWPLGQVLADRTMAALLLVLGLAGFATTMWVLGSRFASAAMAATGAPASGTSTGDDPASFHRFRGGIARSLRRKEWRLMLRDPNFFTQLGLQIIYTVPIAVVLMRSHLVPTAFALVPTIVVIAGQVAGSIAWITVSGEDAPELIASAPVARVAVDRSKLSAVALPVSVILALPLAGLATTSWRMAAVALVFAVGAGTSTALLNFCHPMPGNRRGMLRRHSQSKLIGLAEHGIAMLWAFAVVFALVGSGLALVPLALVAAILAVTISRAPQARAR